MMRVSLLGVEFNSANRGCGALAYSICEILKKNCESKNEKLHITAVLFEPQPIPKIECEGVTFSYIKNEPKKLSFWKNCYHAFQNSDVVLDFSMGDSFADIYGKKRFFLACLLKELAIKSKAKFIMAPQTIGPFEDKALIFWAKHILKKSDYCFVRDNLSADFMKKMCGRNPLLTTDVAFALPYDKKEKVCQGKKKIGFNPSGLLWFGTKEFSVSKHITVNYKEYVERVLSQWIKDETIEVHLIPHVFTKGDGATEDDLRACLEIKKMFPSVIIESDFDTPMEIKSFISTMDVFIGARMHATVGAFSSGIATIPFSYSRKFEGLYNDLGYHYLISATMMNTDEAVEKTINWVMNHEQLLEDVKKCQGNLPQKQKVFYDVLNKI